MILKATALSLLLIGHALAAPIAKPQTSTIDTSHGINSSIIDSQILHIADERPGSSNTSNNSSTNTSCCSSDPKGSSNSSSNRSTNRSFNADDFLENGKKGPTAKELFKLQEHLAKRGIKFQVKIKGKK